MNTEAINALHAFFSSEHMLAKLKSLRPLVLHHNVVPPGFLSDMPRLSEYLQKRDPQWFLFGLNARGNGSTDWDKVYLARVQSVLIYLTRNPEMKTRLLAHFPELADLEALPALGWQAYDELLNGHSGSCFDGRSMSHEGNGYLERSISRFGIFEDRIEGIFISNQRGGYYGERLSLFMPEEAPKTFGEELLALDKVVYQALWLFRQYYSRGQEFYKTVPRSMIYQFHHECSNAVKLVT